MCSHGLYRAACKAGDTPEAVLGVSLGDLGRAPALSLLGVGADRPKWCPAESKMFRHADKALAGSFHGIRVVPARIVSPGAVQVGSSSLRSLRRISSHSMRRSLQNGSYGSYYLLGPALVQPCGSQHHETLRAAELCAKAVSEGQECRWGGMLEKGGRWNARGVTRAEPQKE